MLICLFGVMLLSICLPNARLKGTDTAISQVICESFDFAMKQHPNNPPNLVDSGVWS